MREVTFIPTDCLCFGNNVILLTEGLDATQLNTTERTEFSCQVLGEDSSLLGFCKIGGDKICCYDSGTHCIYELNIASRDV